MSVRNPPCVDFYFDYCCPWSWLAFLRLQESALRTGSRIRWFPVLLDQVLAGTGSQAPADRTPPNRSRLAWQASDLEAWAEFCGVSLCRRETRPATSEWAQRGAVVALADAAIVRFSEAMFEANFRGGRDLSRPETVIAVAEEAGFDGADFARRLQLPSTLEIVRDNSRALVERGGFGVPSMYVADRLYFGNDRMPLVEFALGRLGERRMIAPGQHSLSS